MSDTPDTERSWAQSLSDERIAEVIESLAYENKSLRRAALYVEAARRLRALDILRDLAAEEAVDDEVVGQGGLVPCCRFCGAMEWSGPLEHEATCVWQRARNLIESLRPLSDESEDP